MMIRNNMLVKSVLSVVVITAFSIACSSSNNNSAPPAAPPGAPGTAPITVSIGAGSVGKGPNAFGTNPLVVNQNQSVIWVNNDTVEHTATADDGSWDTGTIAPGASSSPVPFPSPGTFPYHCAIHGAASMSGVVQVNPGPGPSPSPSVSPSPSASWSEVSERKSCTQPQCPAANGFSVFSDGTHTGSSAAGTITAAELAQLNAAAATVAAGESQLGFSCVQQQAAPGASSSTVELTFSDGNNQQIYSYDTTSQQLCFRGSRQNSEALFQALDSLAAKYDANAGSPAPSPSPSPSMSMAARHHL